MPVLTVEQRKALQEELSALKGSLKVGSAIELPEQSPVSSFLKHNAAGLAQNFLDEGLAGVMATVNPDDLYQGDWMQRYRTARGDARDSLDKAAKDNPKAALGGQLFGGLTSAVAASPVQALNPNSVKSAIAVGAGYGGLNAAGMSEADAIQDPTQLAKDTAIGAGLGGVLGGGIYGATNTLPKAINALLPKSNKAEIDAMMASNLPVTAGQVFSGEVVPRGEALLAQSITGAPLRNARNTANQRIESIVNDASTAASATHPRTMEAAGNTLRQGAEKASANVQSSISAPYDALMKSLPDNVGIPTTNAQGALSVALGKYQYNPKALSILNDELLTNVTSGTIPAGILKTQLRKQVDAIASSTAARDLGMTGDIKTISNALNQDIREAVIQVNPQAGKLYEAADARYAAGKQVIDKIQSFIKTPKDEELARRYINIANEPTARSGRGADAQLYRILERRLPTQAVDELNAYKLSQLGKTETGEFSASRFVQDYGKMSGNARNALINRLPQENKKALQSAYNYMKNIRGTLNPSGTAGGVADIAGVSASVVYGSPLAVLLPYVTSLGASSQNVAKLINKLPRSKLIAPMDSQTEGLVIRSLVDAGVSMEEASAVVGNGKMSAPLVKAPTSSPQYNRTELLKELDQLKKIKNEALPQPAPVNIDEQSSLPQVEGNTGNDYLDRIAQAESSGNPNAKAATSSASGLFQFTDGTWGDMVNKYGAQYGITKEMKNDPQAQRIMAQHLTEENRQSLANRLGREPTDGELYLAHFAGAGGAGKLLSNPQASAAKLLPKAAKSNRSIFYAANGTPRTGMQVAALLSAKI